MRNSVMFVLVAALGVACAAPASDEATQSSDVTTRRARTDAPLAGDELAFESFLHVSDSTNGWPHHSYAEHSEQVRVGAERVAVSAALYLERDRTFTLYYSELEMVDAYNGTSRTQRKLTGTWRANGEELQLGAASARLSGETLVLSPPEGWAGADVTAVVPLEMDGSNVCPNAPFWSDYR